MKIRTAFIVASFTSASLSIAQTVWTDGSGGDPSWSNGANWSTGAAPTTTASVQIGTQPSLGFIGIDTGATTIGSLTFNNTLTGPISFEVAIGDSLQINGAITNNSGFTHTFNLPVTSGANATWTGPLSFNNVVDINTRNITPSGSLSFTSGSDLTFSVTNLLTYGRFLNGGTISAAGNINVIVSGTYLATAQSGDTFTFRSGGFTGANFNSSSFVASNPLPNGLSWNTSNFISAGQLQVIPEPSTFAALISFAAVGAYGFRRRPRKLAA